VSSERLCEEISRPERPNSAVPAPNRIRSVIGLPERTEAPPYYFRYIDRISNTDVVGELTNQRADASDLFSRITEERSLHRYAPEKWSARQVLNHVSDTERVFVFRALWFARGFEAPLPSFDQNVSSSMAGADQIPWSRNVEEFEDVRRATIDFFRNLPADAWMRSGIASDNPFTVRALAFIAAGHLSHHLAILRERYL
jgi:DinB family protein